MVLRQRPRLLAAPAAAAACALLLLGPAGLATSAAAATPSSTSGKTLRVAMDSSGVDTLNPFTAYFNGSYDIFGAIYPTLTVIGQDGRPNPYLATSWSMSSDHLTWTFKIRKGLKWSDGQPLTAADAAWTLNLIMTNEVAGTANGTLVSNFSSVTAPDPTTLVIRTKQPQSNLTYISTPVYSIPIVPEHIWKSHVADLKNYKNDSFPVVGYGPWQLTGYKTDQYATLDANKSFVLGAPKYDHLIEQLYKNSDSAVAALRSGQLDYIEGVNATEYSSLKHASGVTTTQSAGNGWTGLELNPGAKTRSGKSIGTGNPALTDPTLRRAIALSIDKQTLVTKVIDGYGSVGQGYLPPAWPEWVWKPSAGEEQTYDPAKANQLLDQAGYKRGANGIRINPKNGKPLALRLGIHSDDSYDAAISPYVAGWLKAIGVKVEIDPMSMTALNSDLGKGDWDMLMDAWTNGPDPTYMLGIQSCTTLPDDQGNGGNTDAFFCNPAYEKLLSQQQTQFVPAQRAKTVDQMEKILYDADVDLMFYNKTMLTATSSKVTGMNTGTPDAKDVYPAQSSFWSYLKATPKAGDSGSSSSNVGLWVGIAAAVVVVGAGVTVVRRRSGADDRE
ncbi:peptide/nickel transport system substrate-binding protein [Actinacidiphila yanglinensis]|uniref:Peptide/nickel transport system substrate-binding protein n=1 Tax=Actinacidiphila yanglinensis TaxID=310779 RepID=A0A1H6DR07_9ACTN|nr:ABC transporter substrate-binding protein [Actinacidiphila yanglinensis]SEG87729.1 peptide/nickel transport system substrate-binding protein [Actinacidiphila yanglinensis]